MGQGEGADVEHFAAERGNDNAVAHADEKEEEEGEAGACGGQDGGDDQEGFGTGIEAVPVLVVVEEPGEEGLDDEEDEDGGKVILHGEDVVAVEIVEDGPAEGQEGVDDGQGGVEGEFGDLGCGEVAEGVAELDDGGVGVVGIGEGADAVVACVGDVVILGVRVGEVDREVDELAGGHFGGIVG